MTSGSLGFLDTGRIVSHDLAIKQVMVYVFENIIYQTGVWYSVIGGAGLNQIKIFQLSL